METHQVLLDMYVTAGVGVLALLVGMFFTRTIPFLKRLCIPAPVSGGILISLLTLAFYAFGGIEFSFDGTIKDICMLIFFTSVGYQSNLKVLKQGGRPLILLVVLVAVLIAVQNGLAAGPVPFRVRQRVVTGGILGDGCDDGAFGQSQLCHILTEIFIGRSLYAIASGTQIDRIQVILQDLVL